MGGSKLVKASSGNYAELPAELIRKIYARAYSVPDRLRGLAVCKSWQRALQGVPFETLGPGFISRNAATLVKQCLWVIARRPAFRKLRLPYRAGHWHRFLQAMLHSVQREMVEYLHFHFEAEVLPYPAIFPNLATLDLFSYNWDADWLAYLSHLPKLQSLRLSCRKLAPEELPSELPPLEPPALTKLDLHIPYHATVRITLWPLLPALQKLSVTGMADVAILGAESQELAATAAPAALQGAPEGPAVSGTAAALSASQPAWAAPCAMHSLELGGSSVTIDFSGLAALSDLSFQGCLELVGASTLAGATALQGLAIFDSSGPNITHAPLTADWVSELLQAAPASLRHLEVHGDWGWEQGHVIGGMSQLQALGLTAGSPGEVGSDQDRVPLADGAVWRGLRACRWFCGGSLPEALRQSTQLELLSFQTTIPTMLEIDLLEALPALRRLGVDSTKIGSLTGEMEQVEKVLLKRLPHLRELNMGDDAILCGTMLLRCQGGRAEERLASSTAPAVIWKEAWSSPFCPVWGLTREPGQPW